MKESRREYLKRINFILDFIEKNLDTNLSLEQLSQKAYYSPYHFHRVFSTIVGESLNEYINRKRVERIASILLSGLGTPIKELAYTYGFNSESSFSRTFKKFYGMTPTSFKLEGKNTLSKIGIDPFSAEKYICSIDNLKKWIEMNAQITVKELREIKLAAIMHIGEFEKIGDMYQRLMEWGHKKGVLTTSNFKAITIYHDNPNITQFSKVRYSAGVTIDQDINAEGEIRPFTIQKDIYAVGKFEINVEEIPRAWKSMCMWVIEKGYEFRDGDYFEMYHNDHRTHPEQKFLLDICIPLEKTANIKLNKTSLVKLSLNKDQSRPSKMRLDFHELIGYMKELRAFFHKEYDTYFKLGSVYQGNPNYSYFSLATGHIKKQKLKFVIVLDHKMLRFTICLSGQNKSIRKKYWEMFKYSDWDKYHLAESIHNSLSIIDQTMVEEPDFNNKKELTRQIETASLKFINEISDILE